MQWPPSTLGSLVKQNSKAGYVAAYISKKDTKYYQIRFLLFDNNMRKTAKLPYTLATQAETDNMIQTDYTRVHLSAYGKPGSDQYMLYYTTTDMVVIECCSKFDVMDNRCFGPIAHNFYQIVSFSGGAFKALTAPVSYKMKIDADTRIQSDTNGDLIWALFDNTAYPYDMEKKLSITFTRLKNCSN